MLAAIIYVAVIVVCIVSMWKVYEKLGLEGWKAIIPIYSIIVLLELFKWDIWKIVLFLIPIVNIVFGFLLMQEIATKFGKGTGFAVGLFILPIIFFPILAFKDENVVIQE